MADEMGQERLADVTAIPGAGSYRWRVADNRLTWSDGMIALSGRAKTPIGEFGFLDCIHPDDRARVEALILSYLESGDSYAHSFRILRPDGQVRLIHDRGTIQRAPDGRAVVLSGVCFDITNDPVLRQVAAPAYAAGADQTVDDEHLRRATNAAGFGFYDFDIAQGRARWSRELLAIIGRHPAQDTGSMEMALMIVHPDDRERVRGIMSSILQILGPYDLEYRILTDQGGTIWVRDRGETTGPIDPKTGLAKHASGVLNDITRRKEAEDALKNSNALLEALFSNAPVGLGVWDRDFRFVKVNDKLAEVNGIPARDHIGRTPSELLPDIDGLEPLYDIWRGILETGEPSLDVEISGHTPADPSRLRYWNEHFFPVREEGEVVALAALVEDITDRKEAEASLRRNATHLQRILDGNVGFVGILEVDGTVLEANAPALKAAGLTRDDVIGRKFWDCYWWTHSDAAIARLRDAVTAAAAGETVRYDAEVRMIDNIMITIDFQLTPIKDDDGRVTHLLPSGFDVTERNRAMEQAKLLMEEVNHRSKNVLSLVQVIACQTVRSSPEDFLTKFSDRITALARGQDLLVKANWNNVDLENLIRVQLAYFDDALDHRILLSGPSVTIGAHGAQALSMIVHELATNAGKYGALSTPHGKVTISWSVEPSEGGHLLSLDWTETDGPTVTAPESRGFGSKLMETMAQAEFGCMPRVEFAPTGLRWLMERAAGAVIT